MTVWWPAWAATTDRRPTGAWPKLVMSIQGSRVERAGDLQRLPGSEVHDRSSPAVERGYPFFQPGGRAGGHNQRPADNKGGDETYSFFDCLPAQCRFAHRRGGPGAGKRSTSCVPSAAVVAGRRPGNWQWLSGKFRIIWKVEAGLNSFRNIAPLSGGGLIFVNCPGDRMIAGKTCTVFLRAVCGGGGYAPRIGRNNDYLFPARVI